MIKILLLWGAFLSVSFAQAMESASSIFFDPQDHYLDASVWLLKHRGFLPVPIIITEPAVGTGLGVALLFMSEKDTEREARPSETHKRFIPPTVTGVIGAGTDNGTAAGGAFYVTNWDRDRWRYAGFVLATSANLDFYGLGGFSRFQDIHLQYNLKGGGIYNDLRARIADSDFFVGGRYIYTDLTVDFNTDNLPPVLQNKSMDNRNGGISILLSYDSRNNTMSPESGLLAEYRYYVFSENLGEISITTCKRWMPRVSFVRVRSGDLRRAGFRDGQMVMRLFMQSLLLISEVFRSFVIKATSPRP